MTIDQHAAQRVSARMPALQAEWERMWPDKPKADYRQLALDSLADAWNHIENSSIPEAVRTYPQLQIARVYNALTNGG
jgi:uncharacterized protein (DUF433 family)